MITVVLSLLQTVANAGVDWWDHVRRAWEYILLALSGIVTEEATPLIGGLRVHTGHLRLFPVMFWVAAGTWTAHMGLYYLGRWRVDWVKRRFPRARAMIQRVLAVVRRHPWRSSLAVRFAYGLRLTLPIACGAARVPLRIYVPGSGISAATWSVLFTLLGWGLGETTMIVVGHVRRYEKWIAIAILVVIVLALYAMRRQHVEEEVVEVLSVGDERRQAEAERRQAESPKK